MQFEDIKAVLGVSNYFFVQFVNPPAFATQLL